MPNFGPFFHVFFHFLGSFFLIFPLISTKVQKSTFFRSSQKLVFCKKEGYCLLGVFFDPFVDFLGKSHQKSTSFFEKSIFDPGVREPYHLRFPLLKSRRGDEKVSLRVGVPPAGRYPFLPHQVALGL